MILAVNILEFMSQDLIGKNQGWLPSRSLNTLAPAYVVLARKF